MFSIRRYVVYFILAAVIVFTYKRLIDGQNGYSDGYSMLDDPVYSPPDGPEDSQQTGTVPANFKWSEVTTHYPVPTYHALPTGQPLEMPVVQHAFTRETSEQAKIRKQRQAHVLGTFKRGWAAYRKYAWMHDEVLPLSAGHNDKFGGWGATLVDNLDTLWIMGLKKEFEEAVKAAVAIDTTRIKLERINVFETTIRHLGGLLAAYDLSHDKRLLMKAEEFGHMLYKAFDTSNHLPITRWLWEPAMHGVPQELPDSVLLAEIGSLSMEFTRLSQVTGDPKWFDAVHRITLLFETGTQKTQLPGMFPISIGVKVLRFDEDSSFTLNGMADSFYEYLPKMHLLLGGREPAYEKLYTETLAAATRHTLFRPMTFDNADILFSGVVNVGLTGPVLRPEAQHLGCFTGGMYMLGGTIFQDPSHFKIGKKLTNGCIWAYKRFPHGVMTETFTALPCEDVNDCQWNEQAWRAQLEEELLDETDLDDYIAENRLVGGILRYNDRKYHLRPEAIESVFMLYRMTGDASLLDTAWDMYTAIMNITTTELANAAVEDATRTSNRLDLGSDDPYNKQFDSMESFWLAETLKYFYLIFSEPSVISLDEWVFNTEAHPFRRPQ